MDLTATLQSWPYDSDNNVRVIFADDGREVLQVRLPLGVEQYELNTRPDGSEPRGFSTILEYVEDKLRQHVIDNGTEKDFVVDSELAGELQAEGILFYYRYMLLYQIKRYELVVRDTRHNLNVCDVLERFCPDEDARNAVLQFRPYIIRMNAAAAALSRENDETATATLLDQAVDQIIGLKDVPSPAFHFERVRSVNFLRSLKQQLGEGTDESAEPADDQQLRIVTDDDSGSPMQELEARLKQAIDGEEYELAARLRDQIRSNSLHIDKEN